MAIFDADADADSVVTLPHAGPAGGEWVQPEILDYFPDLVRELGGDPDAMLARAGIDPAALAARRGGASYGQLIELLDHAATSLPCRDFGMRLALRQQGSRIYGPLGAVMRHSRTFHDAVAHAAAHGYAHSLAAQVWMRPLPGEGMVLCGHDILLDRMFDHAQTIEQVLLVGNLGAIELTGGRARARAVLLRHQPVAPIEVYRRNFGCDVLFGRHENGLLFTEADMASAIVEPDAASLRIAFAQLESRFDRHAPPLRAQVRGIVMRRLGRGGCSNARVAADLGLTIRTLRRRLAAEGTSFQAIKDAVRREGMLYYVARTSLPFGRISEALGLAEQAILSRLCNRWFGMSPRRLRAETRRG